MALQKYLAKRSDRPQVVSKQTKRKRAEGTVMANVPQGEVFLKSDGGKVYRLTWAKGDKQRRRHLPAGSYQLTGYRLVKGDWFVSATGGRSRVKVRRGKTTRLKVAAGVAVKFRAQRKGRNLFLGMGVQGSGGMGLSIYRGGKRIPIQYRLLSSKKKELASGKMNYG